jgi:NADPH2:quinone reductase
MKAWRVHRHGRPSHALRLDEVPAPEPGPGQVRVRAAAGALKSG